jgi:hypothetical protein
MDNPVPRNDEISVADDETISPAVSMQANLNSLQRPEKGAMQERLRGRRKSEFLDNDSFRRRCACSPS